VKEVKRAVAVYRDEYNCAQSILSVYGARLGLDEDLAKRIACGLGAGMGRLGTVCGAVTGAIMVLGLRYGMADSARQEQKLRTYEKVRELISRFEKRHGTTVCNDLLGCDISTPEGLEEAEQRGLTTTVCEGVVLTAGEILEEMLEKE
jgi:C_GCAxxG_C_C family probable redox protein